MEVKDSLKHHIFVYEGYMKEVYGNAYGLTDKTYVGLGCLYGYKRNGFNSILKTDNDSDAVLGQIYEIPNTLKDLINLREVEQGYTESIEEVVEISEWKDYECVVFYEEEVKNDDN